MQLLDIGAAIAAEESHEMAFKIDLRFAGARRQRRRDGRRSANRSGNQGQGSHDGGKRSVFLAKFGDKIPAKNQFVTSADLCGPADRLF